MKVKPKTQNTPPPRNLKKCIEYILRDMENQHLIFADRIYIESFISKKK